MPKFEKRYVSAKEINQIYGISPKILSVWRLKRVGPKFIQLGPKMFRYKIADLEAWIKENEIETREIRRY